MRTKEEIVRAVGYLEEAYRGAMAIRHKRHVGSIRAMIEVLEWTLRRDGPDGFGDMLKSLESIGPPRLEKRVQ